MDAVIVGSVGTALLLAAFFLSLFRYVKQDSWGYIVSNCLGAGMSAYASYLIGFYPFVVLEGTWSVVAFAALVKKFFLR